MNLNIKLVTWTGVDFSDPAMVSRLVLIFFDVPRFDHLK
jgi:hypothetical protein